MSHLNNRKITWEKSKKLKSTYSFENQHKPQLVEEYGRDPVEGEDGGGNPHEDEPEPQPEIYLLVDDILDTKDPDISWSSLYVNELGDLPQYNGLQLNVVTTAIFCAFLGILSTI